MITDILVRLDCATSNVRSLDVFCHPTVLVSDISCQFLKTDPMIQRGD